MTLIYPPPEHPVLSVHPDRQIISLSGEGVRDFLNDILTAQIKTLTEDRTRAACLLSPQGRILFDMMVIAKSKIIYLVTETRQAAPLVKRLMMYRLRRKIEIRISPDLRTGHIWGDGYADMSVPDGCISVADERHNALGRMILFSGNEGVPTLPNTANWQAMRISLGIPEGADDLTPNRALMLEAGLHLLGAIDFDKGCYVGQEVTARTHYRGLVKRRLLPVVASGPLTPRQAIQRGDVTIGQVGSTASMPDGRCAALASLRLDAVQAVLAGAADLATDNGQRISLHIPAWMPPLPGFDEG